MGFWHACPQYFERLYHLRESGQKGDIGSSDEGFSFDDKDSHCMHAACYDCTRQEAGRALQLIQEKIAEKARRSRNLRRKSTTAAKSPKIPPATAPDVLNESPKGKAKRRCRRAGIPEFFLKVCDQVSYGNSYEKLPYSDDDMDEDEGPEIVIRPHPCRACAYEKHFASWYPLPDENDAPDAQYVIRGQTSKCHPQYFGALTEHRGAGDYCLDVRGQILKNVNLDYAKKFQKFLREAAFIQWIQENKGNLSDAYSDASSDVYLNELDRMVHIPWSANEDRAAAVKRSVGQGTAFEDGALKNRELPAPQG